jgi:hypothetical protein
MPPTCPRRAPYSQHRLPLALASRRLRSRFQHWTALTIDHHLALDTLVMSRSMLATDQLGKMTHNIPAC